MKQKIVIKVYIRCAKCRKEAMKIAASSDGVLSVALQGNDKDQIVVVGNEVDSAGLCNALRKKIGDATLVSVEEVKDPKPDEKKKEEPKKAEEKKAEEKKAEEKKQENSKKPEAAAASNHPCPGMYYHPPPQFHCPNPQYFTYALPPDDNQGCYIM